MTPTILVTAPTLAAAGLDLLTTRGCRVLFTEPGQGAVDIEALMTREPVDAVISRTLDLTAAALKACPTLKVVCKHGVGVSNIDVDIATALGIPVLVTPGANAQSVAEMTLALMFAAARRVPWMDRQLRQGQWSRAQDGLQLSGRTLGLVGYGQVARRVAAAARAIGMAVVVYDPLLPADAALDGVERVERLDQLLPLSHVLSLHIPLTVQTRQLIGAAQLAALPADALLINTARGEVVDEAALIAALQARQLFAAGLDTMAIEPLQADSPLLQLDNVVLTPHVGGSTPAALAAMAQGAARQVLDYLDGKPATAASCVNPQVLNR
ncbi:NAD(P)-dependent oxidoreductase [Pseudomonas sp. NPDC089401]|uniref:NAD(P)-dependent oxidoreductase n=1 Tax=Pseudomonas sp. NPDC089401 TaxID=3364462 RepID=UPI00381E2847